MVRPILEMVFDEGPKNYHLNSRLLGDIQHQNFSMQDRRVAGFGQNYTQKIFKREILDRSQKIFGNTDATRQVVEPQKTNSNILLGERDRAYDESAFVKYYTDANAKKRKKVSAVDLILDDKPYLREYAR